MVDAYAVPNRIHLARRILRPIFRSIFYVLSRVRITGLENVPTSGAYLIAFNHVSIVDPPLVTAFWPVAPEVMGAVEVWGRPGQSLLARWYGGIPVHRDQYDRQCPKRTGPIVLLTPTPNQRHLIYGCAEGAKRSPTALCFEAGFYSTSLRRSRKNSNT